MDFFLIFRRVNEVVSEPGWQLVQICSNQTYPATPSDEVGEGDGWDFLAWLGPDPSAYIFHRLDDPADLARAAAVCRSWRRFVIANEFCKSLCRRICPDVARFTRAVEVREWPPAPAAQTYESSNDAEKHHRIYSYLGGALVSSKPSVDCILRCISASSTDRFPDERMENTLDPRNRVGHRPSYWSSKGHNDPDVPESLTYCLKSDLCIIDEIRKRPFQVYFEYGHPICSSKMVRIRIGYCKDNVENQRVIADENYEWTYTSPEFPMLQENVLQSFKLPRPVLCIGGVVKIELLGRIEKAIMDDMYYICICYVQVIGRTLSPVFMVGISDSAGYPILKYLPDSRN